MSAHSSICRGTNKSRKFIRMKLSGTVPFVVYRIWTNGYGWFRFTYHFGCGLPMSMTWFGVNVDEKWIGLKSKVRESKQNMSKISCSGQIQFIPNIFENLLVCPKCQSCAAAQQCISGNAEARLYHHDQQWRQGWPGTTNKSKIITLHFVQTKKYKQTTKCASGWSFSPEHHFVQELWYCEEEKYSSDLGSALFPQGFHSQTPSNSQ